MIRLEILSGKQAGRFVTVRRFPFCIGRSPDADLPSLDPGVWDQHCRVEYESPEGFMLVPCGSARTAVDAGPVTGSCRLKNGAEIVAGSLRMRFTLGDPRVRGLRIREAGTWLLLTTVVVLEGWLITVLGK